MGSLSNRYLVFVMLGYFLALICTANAGIYRFSTETTPWDFKLATDTPDNSWFPTYFFEEYELGPPDRTGAMPLLIDDANEIEKKLNKRRMRPICEDYWFDLEASEFCKMQGYYRGRRASVTTKHEFVRTHLYCFDFTSISTTQLFAIQRCTVTDYKDAKMACTPDQAAAVYCWDEKWIPQKVVVLSVTNTMKKFKIKIMVGSEKYGRFYNALDIDETLDAEPVKTDFKMVESGNTKSLKIKVKFQNKGGAVTLSGKFPKANICFELWYKETRFVQCMKSAKIKIKDLNEVKREDEALLTEKFVLEKQKFYLAEEN